jgi:hypothetical protein
MAHVTDAGLLTPDPGDTLQMSYYLKAKDYGRYDRFPPLKDSAPLTWPQGVAHHITDSLIDLDDYDLDMLARVKAYAAMPYHTQFYLGLNGQAGQIIPVSRAAMGIGGSVIFRGAKHEANNLFFHAEWVSMLLNHKGEKWRKDPKTGKTKLIYRTDPNRPDLAKHPNGLWLKVPDLQRKAMGDALVALRDRLQVNPLNLFHGHYQLGRGTHVDPGPEVIAALYRIGVERFDLPETFKPFAGDTATPVPYPIPDNPARGF